jgi:hypothetical protein
MNQSTSSPFRFISKANVSPNLMFVVIILTALIAFEMFNYSTTDFALSDLLGDLRFAGVRWATILSIAFCGIDFAGVARLFTPERGSDEPKEVWYLFGAWLLAATMNAILTWWGVSMAVLTHNVQSVSVIDSSTLTKIVPIFVAMMVWVIRILIIGSLSIAGDRLFGSSPAAAPAGNNSYSRGAYNNNSRSPRPVPTAMNAAPVTPRPSPRTMDSVQNRPEPVFHSRTPEAPANPRPEPTYHSLNMTARPAPRPTGRNGQSSTPTPRRRL